jgi:aspartate 1-decarboxylase
MRRLMLKSKIHRATLTGTELGYEGSVTVDAGLLEKADILPGEQVHVLNVTTGARFITYSIPAPRGSGAVVLNGPAARLGEKGDAVIILSYSELADSEARKIEPKIVLVGPGNRPRENRRDGKPRDRGMLQARHGEPAGDQE